VASDKTHTLDLVAAIDARIDGARSTARQIEELVSQLDAECHGPFAVLARQRISDLERIAKAFELARPRYSEDQRPAA